MLENNSWLCSEIINACMKIIAKQFPHTPINLAVFDLKVPHISQTSSAMGLMVQVL
jgi:hypothetical protein